ncbi:hypothetical protein HDV01_000008 [Terramyces sp. JEL0728]|nr:hypothetical protein HDV01_000008 [Terramyces sp. JEL0728]
MSSFILWINIIQSLIIVYWIVSFYIAYSIYVSTWYNTYNVISTVSDLQILLVLLADIEVMTIFAVLNPTITKRILYRIRIFLIALYVLFPFSTRIAGIFTANPSIVVAGNVCVMFFAILAVILDNIQNIYLLTAIYKFKDGKCGNELSTNTINQFKKLSVYLAGMLLVDWTAIAFHVYFTFTTDKSYFPYYYNLAGCLCICIHTLGLIFCLMKLKDLSLSKNETDSEPNVPLKKLADLKIKSASSNVHEKSTRLV